MTKTAAHEATALELLALADEIDLHLTEDEISALDDLKFGQAIANQRAARILRERAATLRAA